eukprot:13930386-Ditylum_brightwellii.AAC.1
MSIISLFFSNTQMKTTIVSLFFSDIQTKPTIISLFFSNTQTNTTINNNTIDGIYDEDTIVLDNPSVSVSSVWSLETVTKDDDILEVNMCYTMHYHQKWLGNLLVISLANGVNWFWDWEGIWGERHAAVA